MEMHQIRYFLAVCETLNFTRAAETCHVSQPSLTFAIKRLEEELGGELFDREKKRIRLTRLGEVMQPHLGKIMTESRMALDNASQFLKLNKTPIKIGALMTLGPVGPSRFFRHFQQCHPGVEVELIDDHQPALLQNLLKGELDAAFINSTVEVEGGMELLPLFTENYLVVFPKNHPFESKSSISLAEVSGMPYVDRLSCEMRDMVIAQCQSMEIDLYATYRSEREDWVQGMVKAELGFAFMPENSVTLEGMQTRPLVEPEVSRQVSLAYHKGRTNSPALAALIYEAESWHWGR